MILTDTLARELLDDNTETGRRPATTGWQKYPPSQTKRGRFLSRGPPCSAPCLSSRPPHMEFYLRSWSTRQGTQSVRDTSSSNPADVAMTHCPRCSILVSRAAGCHESGAALIWYYAGSFYDESSTNWTNSSFPQLTQVPLDAGLCGISRPSIDFRAGLTVPQLVHWSSRLSPSPGLITDINSQYNIKSINYLLNFSLSFRRYYVISE